MKIPTRERIRQAATGWQLVDPHTNTDYFLATDFLGITKKVEVRYDTRGAVTLARYTNRYGHTLKIGLHDTHRAEKVIAWLSV